MVYLVDMSGRKIRFTDERAKHVGSDHPEMDGQISKITETLSGPDYIVRSRTDPDVELFYKYYVETPVGGKYLCVVVKTSGSDSFVSTSYFTDTVKKGRDLWTKK